MTNNTAYLLVFLMSSVWILSETTFHLLQIGMEICLLLLFSFMAFRVNFSLFELIIITINLIFISFSFAHLELNPAIIVTKNLLLCLLAYCVLSRYELKLQPIYYVTLICVMLILIQLFVTKRFPLQIGEYLTTSHWLLESRPLGLFLAEHSSAYFIASVFFGYCLTKKMWLMDLFLVFKTGVATPLFALLGAKIIRWIKPARRVCEHNLMASVVLLISILIFCFFIKDIIIDSLYFFYPNIGSSAEIILRQMYDLDYYVNFLSLYPNDILEYENTIGVPEIGYVRFGVEFGSIFTISYIFLLLKGLRSWRIFILISLLHYSFVHVPLIIYVMFLFQSIQDKKEFI